MYWASSQGTFVYHGVQKINLFAGARSRCRGPLELGLKFLPSSNSFSPVPNQSVKVKLFDQDMTAYLNHFNTIK